MYAFFSLVFLRGEGKEEGLGERILRVLNLKCYSILANIIFCQWNDHLLRSQMSVTQTSRRIV